MKALILSEDAVMPTEGPGAASLDTGQRGRRVSATRGHHSHNTAHAGTPWAQGFGAQGKQLPQS